MTFEVGAVVRLNSDVGAANLMTVQRSDWNQVTAWWLVDGDIQSVELPPRMFTLVFDDPETLAKRAKADAAAEAASAADIAKHLQP